LLLAVLRWLALAIRGGAQRREDLERQLKSW